MGSPLACGTLEISGREVQQLLRGLGMRQTIYTPIFDIPDKAIFTVRLKSKILESTPGTWYETLISMLSSGVGQDICNVGQSTADLVDTGKH